MPVVEDAVMALIQLRAVHFQMITERVHGQLLVIVLTMGARKDGVLVKCLQMILEHVLITGQVDAAVESAHVALVIRYKHRLLRFGVARIAGEMAMAHSLFSQRLVFHVRTIGQVGHFVEHHTLGRHFETGHWIDRILIRYDNSRSDFFPFARCSIGRIVAFVQR